MNKTTLIHKARAYCEQRGARFTPLREKVYEILVSKHGPMGAYELLDSLKETESSAKPATVYRALDFLLDFGFIHRLESTLNLNYIYRGRISFYFNEFISVYILFWFYLKQFYI